MINPLVYVVILGAYRNGNKKGERNNLPNSEVNSIHLGNVEQWLMPLSHKKLTKNSHYHSRHSRNNKQVCQNRGKVIIFRGRQTASRSRQPCWIQSLQNKVRMRYASHFPARNENLQLTFNVSFLFFNYT